VPQTGFGFSRRKDLVKIIVCVKQVPAKDAPLAIAGNWIKESDIGFEMNEPDSYALEEALRLKEKHGGEVIALSMGPERVKQTIKEALAKGADRGIHILDDNFAQLDPLGSAKCLAAAIQKEKADLVLTGLQSDDHGFSGKPACYWPRFWICRTRPSLWPSKSPMEK